jgi:nucleoid-associated protein YgaU
VAVLRSILVVPAETRGRGVALMERRSRQREQLRWKRAVMPVLVALVLICSPLFARSVSRPRSVAPVAPVTRVVVQQGDTLWGIATQYGPPREDVRSIVHRIQQANRLDTSLIHPGDVLLVPQ